LTRLPASFSFALNFFPQPVERVRHKAVALSDPHARLLTDGTAAKRNVSLPTRFDGTVEGDTRLFSLSEENPDRVLMEEHFRLAKSHPATVWGEITGTVELTIPDQMPPSTPVDSAERIHLVWSLILAAYGSRGRRAETEYILSVATAPKQ
jgi:hypothetical protein